MKIKLNGVQETLLIPLIAKANETKKSDRKINDPKAVEMASKIDYDFSKFEKTMSLDGVIARTRILDREIQKYIDTYPDALCISVGCGLDTRYQRLNRRKISWINLDFPDVIKLRKQLLFEGKNVHYIEKSALDASWIDEVPVMYDHVLIILEGILMYFTQEEVIQLFCMLHNHFKNCTIFAEIMNPFIATQTKHHDTVKKTNAQFHWGVKSGKDMERLCEDLVCVNEWNLTDIMMDMGFQYRIMRAIPFIKNKNNKIVELKLNMLK